MGVFQEQGFRLYSLTTFSDFDYFITILFFFFFSFSFFFIFFFIFFFFFFFLGSFILLLQEELNQGKSKK